MKRYFSRMGWPAAGALLTLAASLLLGACASPAPDGGHALGQLRGTGDLGLIIERSQGEVAVVDTSRPAILGKVAGLGDLSHASVVFSRDGRYAFVFGRDGGLSKVDLLTGTLVRRILQSGNAIGGAISQDGRLVVAQNYEPGGIRAFDAETLEPLADVPASYGDQQPPRRSRVVGLADLPGNRFAYALFDAGEIWVTDLSDPAHPHTDRYPAGKQPYDGLVTPDGRYYLAGLFGEDGLALLDLWHPERGSRTILPGYGRGQEPLPVYKMPHLRGWAIAGDKAYLPAIGRHEVLVVDTRSWQEIARVPVRGQPVFVMARPDGREVWVNFAFPDNGDVQIIDTVKEAVTATFSPGRAILHLEFTPRGEAVWVSARDDDRVMVFDTRRQPGDLPRETARLPIPSPSGIFMTHRAARMGF